ncbi:hypothetical protein GGR50DRAFT_237547 [Xylaria sp. CBS 124048]|nr:hypothetical protein GGR50DRAFT_237547 [Xylaria sp. CBS 124048]
MARSAAEEENIRLTIGVVTSLLALSTISFILRIWARLSTKAQLWWDDYWMTWVMIVCIGASTIDYIGLRNGSGIHQDELSPATVTRFTQNLWVFMIIWVIGVFSVKIGILLFYWRVFQRTSTFRIGALVIGVISVGIVISFAFIFIFQCRPIHRFWKPEVEGHCINQVQFYLASGVINVIGDVAVLSLPLPVIWGLKTSTSRKWSLSFLFLLGAFVVIASIIRIVAVTQIDPTDFNFSNVKAGLWSTVELQVGFICANLPATRPLFFRWFGLENSRSLSRAVQTGRRSAMGEFRFGNGTRNATRLNEDDNSSTEAFAMHGTKPPPSQSASSVQDIENGPNGRSDIVVRTDVSVMVEEERQHGMGRTNDRFIQVTTPGNHIHLKGSRDESYR